MFFLINLIFSIISSTILYTLYISWSRFCNLVARDFTSSRTFLVMINVATVLNEVNEDFSPWAFILVSRSQFRLPSDEPEDKFGYSLGNRIASRKVTKTYGIPESKHAVLPNGSYIAQEVLNEYILVSTHVMSVQIISAS